MFTKQAALLVSLIATLLAACQAAAPTRIAEAPRATAEILERQTFATQAASGDARTSSGQPAPASELAYPTQAPGFIAPYATPLPTAPAATFRDAGVNPFVDTFEDHLSTFALDVDTASYSIARNYLQQGALPPQESVRVEEFVNYFRQDYPIPPDVAFGLYADGAASPFHTDGSILLRFGVQGYHVAEWERQPAHLTFVIDTSGSMSQGGRLELVKQSLQLLVERLRPSDSVAIVAYSDSARIVLEPVGGAQRDTILRAVYALYPEGSTNAEAGLQLGYRQAQTMHRPGEVNRVILLSDGVANVGATGPDAILESIGWYAKEYGITLTSVGVGMGNFNDVLLEQLADRGNGHYAYIDDLDEARKLFVEDLVSTLQVIALDAKVQVDFNAEVVSHYRLLGYENRAIADQDFRNNAVDAGEIGAGHTVTAVYIVYLKPGAQGRLATVQMRWKDPQSLQVTEINGNFNTWDLAQNFDAASARFQLTGVVAQVAEVLRGSPYASHTSLRDLAARAARLAAHLPEDAEVAVFARLVHQAAQIRGY